jgi:hypothetical protein
MQSYTSFNSSPAENPCLDHLAAVCKVSLPAGPRLTPLSRVANSMMWSYGDIRWPNHVQTRGGFVTESNSAAREKGILFSIYLFPQMLSEFMSHLSAGRFAEL